MGWVFLIGLVTIPRLVSAAEETSATYHGLKADEFMRTWLVLRQVSVPQESEEARRAFDTDFLKAVGGEAGVRPEAGATARLDGTNHHWRLLESKRDIIDLIRANQPKEHVVAYAWAEIEMPEAEKMLFGIGSDDAVKVWLNGELVH